jgi:leucyl aminopeptidase (aminopeptidase T)
VIDSDAFANLICEWCLDVHERDYVLVTTTPLAAPVVRALHRALLMRGA